MAQVLQGSNLPWTPEQYKQVQRRSLEYTESIRWPCIPELILTAAFQATFYLRSSRQSLAPAG
jgi:hypothetical protein